MTQIGILRLASKRLEHPNAPTQAPLEKIPDLDRLEMLINRLGTEESWQDLLAQANADR